MDTYALELKDRSNIPQKVPLHHFPFTIGRGAENDLSLAHSSISRKHASIEKEGHRLFIVDENSRNHVFVNDRQVVRKMIGDGDVLRAGIIEMRVRRVSGVRIPVAADAKKTMALYFPQRESWDPIKNFSSILPAAEHAPDTGQPQPQWQKLLRISLESSTPDTYEMILDVLEGSIPFDRCFLILFEDGSLEQSRVIARRLHSQSSSEPLSTSASEIFVSKEILRRVATNREAVLVTRDYTHLGRRNSFIKSGANSAVCLPLVVRGNVNGVLYLDRPSNAPRFSQEDLAILGPMAGILALKIENIQLLQSYLTSQLNKRELEIAENIQQGLYPKEPIQFPGFYVDGFTRPCHEVGGDYFDFFLRGESELTWAVGDVSGKGLSSALYMVSVLSTLRAHIQDGLPLEVLMGRMERHVRETFRPDYFMTLFIARLDRSSGVLTYCNAGHLPPVVFPLNGEILELESSGPALNLFPWQDFTCYDYQLAPGDLLMAYTDGLIESEGKDREQYGYERAVSCIRRVRNNNLVTIRREIFSELDAFTEGRGLSDDMTVVLLRREEAPE